MDVLTNRALAAAALSTLAQFAALPGPPQSCVTWCEETDAPYLWVPGDVTAVDGVTSIAATGGTAGRWLLGSDRISIAPIGGAADDWPRVMGTIAPAVAAAGVTLELRAGTFNDATAQVTPASLHIRGQGRSTRIVSTMVPHAPGGAESNSPFYADGGNGGAGPITTLNGAALAGTGTPALPIAFNSVVGLAIGDWIILADASLALCLRQIVDIIANTVVLDEPILRNYSNGSNVRLTTLLDNIVIEDLTISGTGDCGIEYLAAYKAKVSNVWIDGDDGSFTFKGIGLDVASRDCLTTDRCHVDGNNLLGNAYMMENGENLWVEGSCTSRRCISDGLLFLSCDGGGSVGGEHTEHVLGAGVALSTNDPTDTTGCRGVKTLGLLCTGNLYGIRISDGSTSNEVEGRFDFNTSVGVYLTTGTSGVACDRNIVRGNAKKNTAGGCFCDNGSKKNQLIGFWLEDNAVVVSAGSELEIIGGGAVDNATIAGTGYYVSSGAGSVIRANGVKASSTRTGAGYSIMFEFNNGGAIYIDGNSSYDVPAAGSNSIGVYGSGAGIAHVNSFKKANGSDGVFLANAAAYARMGSDYDLSGCVSPLTAAGGVFSQGTVILTAAAPVAVAYAPITALDRVVLDRVAIAGGTGLYPLCVITPGVGFALTSVVNDLDTYNWKIV